MNTSNCCSFCQVQGHSVSACSAPIIEQTWNRALCLANLWIENRVDGDFDDVCEYLEQIPTNLLWTIGLQYANMPIGQTKAVVIGGICRRIQEESLAFLRLSSHQRIEMLQRIGDGDFVVENTYPLNSSFMEIDEDMENKSLEIKPILICLESKEELLQQVECPICYDDFTLLSMDTLECRHMFCHGCITTQIYSNPSVRPCCGLCRNPIKSVEVKDVDNLLDYEYRNTNDSVAKFMKLMNQIDDDMMSVSSDEMEYTHSQSIEIY